MDEGHHDETLGDEDRRGFSAVLDTLIPPCPERALEGAGALGVADAILAAAPELAPVIRAVLAELASAAAARGADGFASLDPAARAELLQARDEAQPGLLAGLLFQAYPLYYQHPQVAPALGLEARPPHPEGYALEAGDLGGLERVRARGRLYREA